MAVTDGNGNYNYPTREEEAEAERKAEREYEQQKHAAFDLLIIKYTEYLETLTCDEWYDLYIKGKFVLPKEETITERSNKLLETLIGGVNDIIG